MIYSKFCSKLNLLTKTKTPSGKVAVQATTDGSTDAHDYNVVDLMADAGATEISNAVEKLPLKVFENTSGRRRKPF
jgi:hypothetical protein